MKNIFKYLGKSLGVGFLALAIVVGVGAGSAGATLTLDATSITTTGAYTVTTVATSTVNEFAANTTGSINIGGTAQTSGVTTILGGTGVGVLGGTTSGIALTPAAAGTINIGSATGTGAITVGASTAGQTVNIGTGVGGANTNTVHIADTSSGSTGVNLVTIGDNSAVASITTIKGGNGATAINLTPSNAGGIVIGTATQTTNGTIVYGGTGVGTNASGISGIALIPGTLGTINIGKSDGTGIITLGSSTAGQTVNVGTGAVVGSDIVNIGTGTATVRKTVNIATEAISTTNIGTGNFVNTIHIGDHATPVNLITIGGAASSLALADAQWGITSPGVATFVNTLVSASATLGLDVGAAGNLQLGGVNATTIGLGNGSMTALTVTSSTTGTGTVVLPNDAISTAEIADNTIDASNLAATLTFADADNVSFASVSVTAADEGLVLPLHATDCTTANASVIVDGQVCWESDANTLYVGDGDNFIAIPSSLGSANTWTNVNTFQDNEIFTFAGDEDLAISNTTATTVDPFSVAVTTTNSADAAQISFTLGADDAGVDTVAALRVAVTSSDTAVADIVQGIAIDNLTAADAQALERALTIGSGWDVNQYFNDTTTFIKLANGGTLVLEDDSADDGVDLLSITDAGAIAVGTAVNTSISLTTDNNAANDIALVGGVTVTGSLVPEAATTRSLGGTSAEWGNIYVGDGSAADISTTGLIFGLDQDAILVYEENTSDRVELVGTNADLWIEDVLSLGRQTLTVTDDGTANDTLTVTASYVEVAQDATGNVGTPDIVFSETGANEGDLLIVVRVDGNAGDVTINESDGVVEETGNITLNPTEFDSVMYIYTGTTWVQIGVSNNG